MTDAPVLSDQSLDGMLKAVVQEPEGRSWDLHYLAGEVSSPADDPQPGTGTHLDLLHRVVARLRTDGPTDSEVLLSDLMQCAEWIGDHEPDQSVRWQRWLTQLAAW